MNSYNFSVDIEQIYLEEQLTIPQQLQSKYDSSQKMQQSNDSPLNSLTQQSMMGLEDISDLSNEMLEQQSYEMQYSQLFNEFNKNQPSMCISKFEKTSFCQTLSLKKSIVKTKRTSSKRFKRKQYQSFYANFMENQPFINTFIIFGYIQIEANYLDFSETYMATKLWDRVIQINHVINNKINKRVEFYFDPIGRSGLTDFNELISHLSQKQNLDYSQLASELLTYQTSLTRQITHMKEIRKMVTKKAISENDLISAFDSCHNYFLDYLNQRKESNQQNSGYTHALFFRSNITHCDPEIYESHFSHSFLELLGINPEESKNFIQISSPYLVSNGLNRLRNSTTILKVINSKQKFHKNLPFSIQTKEGIEIECTIDMEIISHMDKPVWMNRYDNFMLLVTFNVNNHQLDMISKSRDKLAEKSEYFPQKSSFTCKGIEEQAQLELFLEKYYPNILKNQQCN